jgi:hypothetical protein
MLCLIMNILSVLIADCTSYLFEVEIVCAVLFYIK